MANDVRNSFTFMCEPQDATKVRSKIDEIREQIINSDVEMVLWPPGSVKDPEYDGRTRFTDEYGDEFGFRSAWGPCTAVQFRLCQILADISPNIAVVNTYSEEFGGCVGVGISLAKEGKITTGCSDEDLSSQISQIREELEESRESSDDDDAEIDIAILEKIDSLIDDVQDIHFEILRLSLGDGALTALDYVS